MERREGSDLPYPLFFVLREALIFLTLRGGKRREDP